MVQTAVCVPRVRCFGGERERERERDREIARGREGGREEGREGAALFRGTTHTNMLLKQNNPKSTERIKAR